MNLIELFARDKAAYMAHVYYGDPNEDFSIKEIKALCESGVSIIELGIPFSDPTADGPVFQRACERALAAGMTPGKVIEGIVKLRDAGITQPIVVTSYYNIIYHMGVGTFVRRIKDSGACALIVPDVPIEEADDLLAAGDEHGIDIIFLVAPTTPDDRLKKILSVARGFVYVVSVAGVTGARESLEEATLKLIERVRAHSDIPLLVGFGISKQEQAKAAVTAGADGVITGSAIGSIYEQHLDDPDASFDEIRAFAQGIRAGIEEGVRKGDRIL
ncbi:MAG: tryptophan synthase subunit alpha [Candidatus Undinarchaeales archaeon]|nr:tryptophan synthase subunit alpha [Candidatus Undinarchaeales archaeon]